MVNRRFDSGQQLRTPLAAMTIVIINCQSNGQRFGELETEGLLLR